VTSWADEYLQMIVDCEARESRMSDWDRAFVDSLGKRLGDGRTLTPKQIEKLNEIWERVTADG